MFIIEPSSVMIAKIHEAMETTLHDVSMILPNLEIELIDRLRWAIFSESRYNMMDRPSPGRYAHVADIASHMFDDATYFLQAHHELDRPFVIDMVRHVCAGQEMHIYVDVEDCDVRIETEPANLSAEINQKDKFYLACSLPDSQSIFESLIQGHLFHDANTWLFPYMEVYDDWAHDVMSKYQRMLWQMGGYGRYIQDDYEGHYIGQINLGIGDGGNVYLYIQDKSIKGSIDMY